MPRPAVAKKSQIPDGHAVRVVVDGVEVLICNAGGNIYAVEDVCTHDGGPLGEGDLDGYEIICPRHGARFDVRTGAVLAFPAITPVESYPVRVEGEDVYVALDE